MKHLISVLMFVSLIFSQSSTNELFDTYYHSDGSSTTKLFDTYYNSDGSSTTKLFDTFYNSDNQKTKTYILDDNDIDDSNTSNWWDPD